MRRFLKAVWVKSVVAAALAAFLTVFMVFLFAVMTAAAWFALGDEMPPPPWFLFKFFLFIGWAIAGTAGLFARDLKGPNA